VSRHERIGAWLAVVIAISLLAFGVATLRQIRTAPPHEAPRFGAASTPWVTISNTPVPVTIAGEADGGAPSQVISAPAVAPVVYQDGGSALSPSTWLVGPYAAVPAGAANATFWITYAGTAASSQLGLRVQLYYQADAGAGGISRILNSSPSISGSVATQTSYTSAVTLAETGTTQIRVPVPVSVSGGVVGVSLDLLEVVQPDAGALYSVSVAWGYL